MLFIFFSFPFIGSWRNVLMLAVCGSALFICDFILGLIVYRSSNATDADKNMFIALTTMLGFCALLLALLYLYYHTDIVRVLGMRVRFWLHQCRHRQTGEKVSKNALFAPLKVAAEESVDTPLQSLAEEENSRLVAIFREELRQEVAVDVNAEGDNEATEMLSKKEEKTAGDAVGGSRSPPPKTFVGDTAWKKITISTSSQQVLSSDAAGSTELNDFKRIVDVAAPAVAPAGEASHRVVDSAVLRGQQRRRAAAEAEAAVAAKQRKQNIAERRATITLVSNALAVPTSKSSLSKSATRGATSAVAATTTAGKREPISAWRWRLSVRSSQGSSSSDFNSSDNSDSSGSRDAVAEWLSPPGDDDSDDSIGGIDLSSLLQSISRAAEPTASVASFLDGEARANRSIGSLGEYLQHLQPTNEVEEERGTDAHKGSIVFSKEIIDMIAHGFDD
jgi:hypothetical protein